MTEDLHVRLSDADVSVLNDLVKRGFFETLSEAVRFGVKQVVQTQRFASSVTPKLTRTQRLALQAPMRPETVKPVESFSEPALRGQADESDPVKAAVLSLEALRKNLERDRELLVRASEAILQLERGYEGLMDRKESR